jgi:hypothetical protein
MLQRRNERKVSGNYEVRKRGFVSIVPVVSSVTILTIFGCNLINKNLNS